MEEYFDVCDENGKPTGQTVTRRVAHSEGFCHRTAHVWIIRNTESGSTEILLQKRSEEKDSFPGCYDTSSAGHVVAGDEPLESAVREMNEELGINASVSDLKPIGSFRNKYEMEFHGRLFKDNEISYVYVYDKYVERESLKLQKSEVSDTEWFDIKYIYEQKMVHNKKFCLTVTGLKILMDYLENSENICNCSTVVIGKDASATGHLIIGHNEDDSRSIIQLHSVPAKDNLPGEKIVFGDNPHEIDCPEHSLGYIWSEVRKPGGISFGDGFFNECGVTIVSDSCASSKFDEEEAATCYLGYGLRTLLAQTATSARHGVEIAKDLVEKYGYFGSRTYHIADKNECWSVQIPKGHRMAAKRIPDDHVYFIPNWFNLHNIDFNDTEHKNYYFSDELASFAQKKGWYAPKNPGDFSDFDFADAFNDKGDPKKGSCRMRERNAWPVLGFEISGIKPFSYKTQHKYGLAEVKTLLRNHWEGRADSNNNGYDRNPHQKGTGPYTLCGPCSVESTITEFTDTPEKTVVWRSWLQPCTNPYVPLFIGNLRTPDNYEWMDTETAVKTHFNPSDSEFLYNPNTAYWIYKSLTFMTELDYKFCYPYISKAIEKYESEAELLVKDVRNNNICPDINEEKRRLSGFSLSMAKKADELVLMLIQQIGMAKYKENCHGMPADEAPEYPGDRKYE